jgi:hypothetical protein
MENSMETSQKTKNKFTLWLHHTTRAYIWMSKNQ